jgi:CubicO group peptidase (beta-lactamase class C family)
MNKTLLSISLSFLSFVSNAQSLYQITDSIRRKHHLPELACAVVSADKIIDITTTGYHRIDKQDAEDTAKLTDHFHLGSNTKAITGFIAAMLVEQGKLKWDTKFFDLYPGLKKEANPAYANITLQQLLSHRAGIQPFTNGEKEKAPHSNGSKSEQRLEFAKYVLKMPPVHPDKYNVYDYSGGEYVYSNAGYSIASLMLEKAAGKSWEELVQDLAKQLQVNIGFGWPNLVDNNQPWGHDEGDNGKLTPLPGNIPYNLDLLEPAGDINMSLPDYSGFIRLQLQGLNGKDGIIKASTYQFLHFGLKAYSIGWGNGISKTKKRYSFHEGSAGTYHVVTLIYPDEDRAFLIFCNASNDDLDKAKDELIKYMQAIYIFSK